NFNALNTKIVNLDLKIDKPLNLPQALNIVAVSDIHLGSNMRNPERLVSMINELKPDIVLIGGDIIDSNIELIRHYEMLEKFKGINTKYGIFSCVGNHEYISRA
ncbi:metallophosphoesterase, partial [Arthrospira platensis SPKY1]|nr:metallophosphoesterase [Arthrospira platensis SPKY1]